MGQTGHTGANGNGNGDNGDSNLPQTFFLGRYRVVDEIGIGGMASVHLARVDGPGGFQKWVAIKRIHPHLVEDDQFVDMFLDEARIAAGINHANVAQVFDLGKDDSTYWIAMEYLHGEPLREILRRVDEANGQIPAHIAARVCADAAEGLHGAHELRGRNGQLLNLVHRDVTPHNLFVTYEGYTKVVDFGIAKVIDRLASTRAGTLKGKLAYMSPEQVRGQEVDRRTDIFALGVVLWELTTGRRLFRMDTDLDTLEKVQACVVPLPTTIVPGYPQDLQEVVMKALAQRKEDRFQTAREFSRALQRFLMKQGTFVGPEDVGDYVKGLFLDRVRKRERYLEWAAEVTSAVDVDALRQQQQVAEQASPSLLHGGSSVDPMGSSSSHVRAAEPAPMPHPAGPPRVPGATGASRPPAPTPYAPSHAQRATVPQPQAHAAPQRPAQAPQQHVAAPLPTYQMRSHGENAASAAVVTSAPIHPGHPHGAPHDLASTSLMDEDEDIPTVVAQPRGPDPDDDPSRPRPAAGMPAWNGAATQLMPEGQGAAPPGRPQGGFDSTIALPDSMAASQIQSKVDELDRQIAQRNTGHAPHGQPQHGQSHYGHEQQPQSAYGGSGPPTPVSPTYGNPSAPPAPAMNYGPPGYPQQPQGQSQQQQQQYGGQLSSNQHAIETKMSLPRPAAVAQWLMEQGDVEIGGPRSTGVIIAIAALATLCVMGVASLIVYKLRLPAQPDPAAQTLVVDARFDSRA
jgi:serine/threonine protein kinase